MAFVTEFEFTLPKGYVDRHGNLHREGIMRLATAADEILPLKDPRVQQNPAYLTIILLSRVVTKLGEVQAINPGVVEGLFSTDLAYLQQLYRQINESGSTGVEAECPRCEHKFAVEVLAPGEA
ncbi:phage tail assembly protein [Paenibacillus sp. MWE-103]|uniref:Phage tail assembly protein n=1 Tax=Paenibacillus artemisiicola TaxID=1172618 RepID=A0ABS3W5J7_9BACL|nr:phage tail assembly protein [Paenibacillus artemisiicola]MBO7743570.1 phage tail assembly protein [Paenibacillus artemisiicola]